MSPIAGVAALGVEAYGGLRGAQQFDGGGRALFMVPIFHIAAGADYLVIGRPITAQADPRAAARRIAEELAQAPGSDP
jgi:orotidine-5'-phosphate decarboxylase